MKTLYRTVSVAAIAFAATFVTGNTASAQDAIVCSGEVSTPAALYSASNQSGGSTNLAALEGGTLTLNGYGGTLTLTGTFGQMGSVLTNRQGATITLNSGGAVAPSTKLPVLTGTVGDVKYKANTTGTGVHVKASVAITNSGTKGAKNVSATVYLSNDSKLDSTDTKFATLKLADYNNGVGTLPKTKTLSTELKRLVPTAIVKGLQGKYLIVVLGADNVDPATVAPIAVGPLNVP